MSQHFQYKSPLVFYGEASERLNVRTFLTKEETEQFNSVAKEHDFWSQRKFDEREAGREFANALDWIAFTESRKGENSSNRLNIVVHGLNKSERAMYTQSREYHSTGGEELIWKKDGTWGCENITSFQGPVATYQADMNRARKLKAIVAIVKTKPLTLDATVQAHNVCQLRAPPGFPDCSQIRLGVTAAASEFFGPCIPPDRCRSGNERAEIGSNTDLACFASTSTSDVNSPAVTTNTTPIGLSPPKSKWDYRFHPELPATATSAELEDDDFVAQIEDEVVPEIVRLLEK